MKIKWNIFNRKVHYWGSAICAIPIIIIIITGILLQFKKESNWIQPPLTRGIGSKPAITFKRILDIAKTIEQAEVVGWEDINRLDVRPLKGIIKIRSKNRWEIQIDHQSGDILQIAYRRSDLIESIHDGSFFHDKVKLWVFLPSAIILLTLWITGLYMFIITLLAKNKNKQKRQRYVADNI